MKIIIYCLNFAPEIVGTGKYNSELVNFLHNKGHKVNVITSPKYYPDWKIKNNKYELDKNFNFKVYRCPIYVPKKPTGIKRILHLISFSITSFPILIIQLFWKPDSVILIAPTILCFTNIFIFKLFSKKNLFTLLHIQDFEIDAAFNLKILSFPLLKNILIKIESYIFKNFKHVSTISHGMIKKLISKGIQKSKIYHFPNWVDVNKIRKSKLIYKKKNYYRNKLKINDETIIIQYAGTLNKKTGIYFLLPIIKFFEKEKNLLWLFSCEGPLKKQFVQLTKNIPNIIFIPLQEEEKFNELLNAADISIIPQKENTEDLFLPSKLISILASGTPVVANVKTNSDLGKLVNEAGIRVDPNDQAGFINAISNLKDNQQLRIRLGKKGRMIAEKMFNKNIVLNNFNDFIENYFNQNICEKDFSN